MVLVLRLASHGAMGEPELTASTLVLTPYNFGPSSRGVVLYKLNFSLHYHCC